MITFSLSPSEIKESLQNIEEIKELSVNSNSLGGHTSLFINLSLDEKKEWINGIYQNSRYSQFVIHDDMKLEQISKHYNLAKFRKCKVKNCDDIASKINQWIKKQS